MVLLQAVDAVIIERWDIAVFLWRQAFQPSLAGMDDESRAARLADRGDEAGEILLVILIVDADAAFHRHRYAHGIAHGADAIAHQARLGHQAGTEAALLHPVRRAADIQVDFAVTEILADFRSLGQNRRVTAADLQCHRLLACIEAQQPLAVAVADRQRCHHLSIQ